MHIGQRNHGWPGREVTWVTGRKLMVSVPFTWCLPRVRSMLQQRNTEWDEAVVGGPGVRLLPRFLDGLSNVAVGQNMEGVLQHVNPRATRTTVGCPRHCPFCAVPRIMGPFRELPDWPDLPVVCDDNLLAASEAHLDRVFERLERHDAVDFNQGIDARLVSRRVADRIVRLRKPIIRLALDNEGMKRSWERAVELLRGAGLPRANIRSYVLIGFLDAPTEAWARCEWVEQRASKALPMWFHPLHVLRHNTITHDQLAAGWSKREQRRIMSWFYLHRKPESPRISASEMSSPDDQERLF